MDIERPGGAGKKDKIHDSHVSHRIACHFGLPPLNGFISEFFIYWGMFNGLKHGIILSVMLVLSISGLACIGVNTGDAVRN